MSSSLPFDVKDRIKQAIDIVEWIGREMDLRRRGNKYYGLCPWHDDNRPSFEVNPTKQSFICRVCDIRGDAFDYVMRREGVEFREAMRILAEHAGIELTPQKVKIVKGSANDKQTLYLAARWAEQLYHQFLLESEEAEPVRQYLHRRQISAEMIELFGVGFAPLKFNWLADRARHTEFSPEVLEACGLLTRSSFGNLYEPFRGRVLFPIYDTQQRPIGFGGRVVPGIYGDQEEPRGKYVNSNETRLFSKSQNLYGLNLYVKDHAAARQRKLVIVEGYTDVIAAYQVGLRNVVAVLGTAINDQHLKLLKRFADQVTMVLDGDEAGQKRANQVLDLFVAHDLDLRVQTLPENADPFDFCLQHGAEGFQQRLETSLDALGHKIKVETAGIDLLNDTHAANRALENILGTMAQVPAYKIQGSPQLELRQGQMLTRLERIFRIERNDIRRRLDHLRKQQRPSFGSSTIAQKKPTAPVLDVANWDRKEAELIQLLLHLPQQLDDAMEQVPPGLFADGTLKSVYEIMEQAFLEGESVAFEAIMNRLESSELRTVVRYLYDDSCEKIEALTKDIAETQSLLELFESVVARFRNLAHQSWHQSALTSLQDGQLDTQDETETLLELLKQAQQQQGILPSLEDQE